MTEHQEPTPQQVAAPVPAPQLPYAFKASLAEYRRRIGAFRILLALGLTIFFWYRFGPLVWIVSVIGIAAMIAAILYFIQARRATITPEGIEYKGAFTKARMVRFDEIEGVKVFVNYLEQGFGVVPRVSIAVKDGAPLVFGGLYWSVDDLDKLLAVLRDRQIATEYFADMATAPAIAKQFPAYATYAEKHVVMLATVITLGIIVAISVGIGLWVAFVE